MTSGRQTISGTVSGSATRTGIADLRVEAWDKDLLVDDLVGSAVTDLHGRFEITFDESHYRELFLDRKPDLFFKVFAGDRLLASTEDSVLWNVEAADEAVEIVVTGQALEPTPFRVAGRVLKLDASPVTEGSVQAFRVRLRQQDLLGEVVPDEAGRFEITAPKIAGPIDLRLRVTDSDGNEIAATPVRYGYDPATAPDVEVVVASEKVRPDPEMVKGRSVLEEALADAQLTLADLASEDVPHLAATTGLDVQQIVRLGQSAKLARHTGVAEEVFYAFASQGLSMNLGSLLAQDPAVLRRALEESGRSNIIPALDDEALDATLARLSDQSVVEALRSGAMHGRASLGRLLTTANLTEEAQQTFLRRYVRHEGPPEDFWQALREDPYFDRTGTIERLQLTLQLGALTQNHTPLVEALLRDDNVTTVRDLASWRVEDFEDRIEQAGIPEFVVGETEAERLRAYATTQARIVEAAFPTQVLMHRMNERDFVGAAPVRDYLQAHPDFDFGSTSVRRYLVEHDEADDLEVPASELELVGRLFPLAPEFERYEVLSVLLADGIGSARQISDMGSGFTLRYGSRMGVRTAREIRARADRRSAMALIALSRYGAAFNSIRPYAIADDLTDESFAMIREELGEGVPDLETLFGSLGLCECSHCRSVYSPAAYLVDILHFLKNQPAKVRDPGSSGALEPDEDRTILDVLYETWREAQGPREEGPHLRRPDLGGIELTCANTNTVLPYVDLVNEALENAVVPFAFELDTDGHPGALAAGELSASLRGAFAGEGLRLTEGAAIEPDEPNGERWVIRDDGWRFVLGLKGRRLHVQPQPQTDGTSEELRAVPEHVHAAAYRALAGDVYYPWNLPFNLFAEEVRAYLEHLDVPRHRLMEVLHPSDPLTDPAVAGEYLGLTPREWRAITGEDPRAPREFWGLDESSWPGALREVEVLLQRAGLDYDELLKVLNTAFVNPEKVRFLDPTCSLDGLEIRATVDDDVLAETLVRIHRFLRLQRRTDLSFAELDKAISVLGAGTMDTPFPLRLTHVLRLRTDLDVPLVELLSWFGAIDTTAGEGGRPSLYDRLFLNETVIEPEDEAFDAFREARNPDPRSGLSMERHTAAVQAALRIGADDLTLLREALFPADGGRLNREHLSRLHRIVSLARALGLVVRDLLSVRALVAAEPFELTRTEDTLRFVETVREIQGAEFGIAELDDLLRHLRRPGGHITPDDDRIARWLEELRTGLRQIWAEHALVPDPTGELAAEKLRLLQPRLDGERRPLREEEIGRAIRIVDGSSEAPVPDQEAYLERFFADFLDIAEAKAKLLHPDTLPASERLDETATARFAYVEEHLLDYLRRTQGEQLVRQGLTDELGSERATTDLLLDRVPVPDTTDPALTAFLDAALYEREEAITKEDLAAAGLEAAYRTFLLLGKITALTARMGIDTEETAWVLTHGEALGWLDLGTLPVDTPPLEPPPPLRDVWRQRFDAWRRLTRACALERALPPGEPSLFAVLERAADPAATEALLLAALAERTGWSLNDLTYLAGPGGFNFVFPETYRDERSYARLEEGLDVIRRIRTSAEQVWSWTAEEITEGHARSVRQAVKAHYEERRWLEVATSIQDRLRERKREALVGYLIADRDEFERPEDLYGHYLIDVEMSACMLTSRIKQAISSVQLFVQRCLLNLEAEATLTPSAVRQWKWMKQYRVWEANRKVFLYPENWVEPELRDNKSPFFAELEKALLQNEVRDETVETALLTYIERLDTVARLEISGLYHQQELDEAGDTALDVLHVFGRTRDAPHIYFYRRWLDQTQWTPWERVDLDIQGDQLVPVVRNRRLYLFWPVFAEKPQKAPSIPARDSSESEKRPHKHWEIQLAWSEHKQGKWLPKRVSDAFVETEDMVDLPDRERFFFKFTEWATQDWLVFNCLHDYGQDDVFRDYGWFVWDDCAGQIKAASHVLRRTGVGLPGTSVERTKYVEQGSRPLVLPVAELGRDGAVVTSTGSLSEVLRRTPQTYMLTVPAQHYTFVSQSPFFYEDATRTFCVAHRDYFVYELDRDKIGPEIIDRVRNDYYRGAAFDFDRIRTAAEDDRTEFDPLGEVLPGVGAGAGVSILPSVVAGGEALAGDGWTASQADADSLVVVATDSARTEALAAELWHGALDGVLLTATPRSSPGRHWVSKLFRFHPFYHPFVCTFIRHLNRYGIDGLLDPHPQGEQPRLRRQQMRNDDFVFESERFYHPTTAVERPYPVEDVDFSYGGSYALYNWELFFHVPLLIATRLCREHRFEEGLRWFHFIFDPTATDTAAPDDDEVPARFWKMRWFYDHPMGRSIEELMLLLSDREADRRERREIERQVAEWRDDPFKPHLIARLRTRAYQLTTVMKYCDCLIAWGDQLFRRDSIESLNEATQLYVLAASILGQRPPRLPALDVPARTFDELEPDLDDFSNALVPLENTLPHTDDGRPIRSDDDSGDVPPLPSLAFCIPQNEKLLGYWDTVEDRLFKIRHCMNIEGVVRQLPLFEPPIDPALLVRAAAAGVDLASALSALDVSLPHYRFRVVSQKATELCGEVRSLGSSLLSALEKRDADGLALLRSQHEVALLKDVRTVREKQLMEAEETIVGLEKAKAVTEERRDYYRDIFMISPHERSNLDNLESAHVFNQISQGINAGVAAAHLIPDFELGTSGWAGSPVATAKTGGTYFGYALRAAVEGARLVAAQHSHDATMASIAGRYQRRWEEWKLQERLADKELERIDKQIAAAEIRRAVAQNELDNHTKQIEQARAVDAFMQDKFTNEELYDWMVSQLSAVYFQSYQLAYDLARRAEKAYQHELALPEQSFIDFGYWDSLKKGLLAGERLHRDLKRMEVAYLDNDRRQYELSKHISLRMLDPIALINLREEGECFISIPHVLFDLDYPGHYLRRIKAVSLTIPCISGPYSNVSCTLTLMSHEVRTAPDPAEPPREHIGAIESIATSSAQNDGGLFEFNFRDERYLPFEGAGAVSRWRLRLPKTLRQFDYDTISDVIFHLRYTAREGGDAERERVSADLVAELNAVVLEEGSRTGLFQMFSAKRDFSTQWHRFLHPADARATRQTLELHLTKERFPFLFRDSGIEIDAMHLFLKTKGDVSDGLEIDLRNDPSGAAFLDDEAFTPHLAENGSPVEGIAYLPLPGLSGEVPLLWFIDVHEDPGASRLRHTVTIDGVEHRRLDPDLIEDLIIVCQYTVSARRAPSES